MLVIQTDPVARALWFIENHSDEPLALADIAKAAAVSPFHLTRAFGEATGHSVMRYLRGRRLSEAAKALAEGDTDILSAALAAGYGSHEAFTRAFREQFGTTPERIRAERRLDGLPLVDALTLEYTMNVTLQKPRIERGRMLLVAGLGERFGYETLGNIPALWQRFVTHLGHIPGQAGPVTYGVVYNGDDDGCDYVAGVEVKGFDALPGEFTRVRLAERSYAIFEHRGHIGGIRATWETIFRSGLSSAGLEKADAPDFERYDERFDPHTGNGTVEIWIPLASPQTS